MIRGLSPHPCARSFLRNDIAELSFKIFESQPELAHHDMNPGEIITDDKHFIKIACKDGFIGILSMQIEGKKRMSAAELLRGFRIKDYTIPVS
jgi:methionyl-tRNA formyltransferase